MLINALANKNIATKEVLKHALNQMQLPEKIRGEKLSLEESQKLSKILSEFIEI